MRRAGLVLVLFGVALSAGPAPAAPVLNPSNGNYYELVTQQTTWAGALSAASGLTFRGKTGHLATITSAAENDFIRDTFQTGQAQFFAWIGGHEPADDGVWLWGAGPEAGVQFSNGPVATAPYSFVAWSGVEPNDFAPGEDFAATNLGGSFAGVQPGRWIDSPNPNPADPIKGYLVEYELPLETPGAGPWAIAALALAVGGLAARRIRRTVRVA